MKLHYRIEPKEKIDSVYCDFIANNSKNAFDNFVVFLDGNSIKTINDTYGHVAGDEVIKHISDTLVSYIRAEDKVVRFGGDEFVIFLKNFNEANLKSFLNRIQVKLGSNQDLTKKYGKLSASMGAVKFEPSKHLSLEALIKASDELMYIAKTKPPSYLCTSSDLDDIQAFKEEKRKEDLLSKRKRSLFNWLVNTVIEEHPEYDKHILLLACRSVWKINANKILVLATVSELFKIVESAYKSEENKVRHSQAKMEKQVNKLRQDDANDFIQMLCEASKTKESLCSNVKVVKSK